MPKGLIMHSHVDEIKYWAEHPNRTKVWIKSSNDTSWKLSDSCIAWFSSSKYIVDDEWAELRKAQADGKQLQCKYEDSNWINCTLTLEEIKNYGNNKEWRIKP